MKHDIYRLKPDTVVAIAPEHGCNLFSWKIDGKELLYCPKGFPENHSEFFSGGNPVLFPSVGRTWDRSHSRPIADIYRVYGKKSVYKMPCHGVLPFGKWLKESDEITEERVRVEYSFSYNENIFSKYYPFRVSFNLSFTLTRTAIRIKGSFANIGKIPAPFAFGLHPYFRIKDRDCVQLHIPAAKRVELDTSLLIPTGRKYTALSSLSLKKGQTYDIAFNGLNKNRASIIDQKMEQSVHVDFDKNIEMLVVYAGANSDFICLEPWTKGLGAYEFLVSDNWQNGCRINVLQPGENKTITIDYSAEKEES